MKRSVIIIFLLLVLAILFMKTSVGTGTRARVPGETTQAEQRQIRGMSVIVNDL